MRWVRAGIKAALALSLLGPSLAAGSDQPSAVPSATLEGRLVSKEPVQVQAVQARYQSVSGTKPKIEAAQVDCPVEKSRWRCEVPAGTLDLRIQAEGFIPLYLWGVEARPDKTVDLGRHELRKGASLIGWVKIDGAQDPKSPRMPQIEARPNRLGRGPGPSSSAERMAQRAFTAQPNPRGFFQLTGLAAGEYVVTASLEGFTPARSEPVLLSAAAESQLRDTLTLEPPLTVEVQLDPPLDPYGQPWSLRLMDAGTEIPPRGLTAAAQGSADLQGFWKKAGLRPARYLVVVQDLTGSKWIQDFYEITAAQPRLDLHLDLVEVEGKISRGQEPVAATLWFARSKGGKRIRFDSDEKGVFLGYLPAEGEWAVDLELASEQVQALEPVQVERLPDRDVARVEIRIPNTLLRIKVTDERSRPVPAAQVILLSDPERGRREAHVAADENGEVTLRGLSPGTLQVYADDERNASSDWVVVQVQEDRDTPEVSLVLRERIELTGHVHSPEGPVAGALVIFQPIVQGGGNAWVGRTITEADGSFRVRLDHSFPGGGVAVLAPGFAARLMPLPPDWRTSRSLTIPVSQAGGTIVVDPVALEGWMQNGSRLKRQGGDLPLIDFLRDGWAEFDPAADRLVLPRMEPGEYLLCPGWSAPPAACSAGYLSAGGELRLSFLQVAKEDPEKGGQP